MRKSLLSHAAPPSPPTDAAPETPQPAQPSFKRPTTIANLGSVLLDLGSQRDLAQSLTKTLSTATHVVELEPSIVDPSPIRDRLADNGTDDIESLRESIRADGQRVPVLLRPNPEVDGRYITVYGHRRVAAAAALGVNVRAIVAALTEEDALVAQGQENNERRNTTFIERAVFAKRLLDRRISMTRIAAALGLPKSAVSEAVKIAEAIPEDLVTAIGPAPDIGRRRWLALHALLDQMPTSWKALTAEAGFALLPSNERFEAIFRGVADASPSPAPPAVSALEDDAGAYVTIRRTSKTNVCIFPIDKSHTRDGLTFAEWIEARLPTLRKDFLSSG